MNLFSSLRSRVWLLVALATVPLFIYSVVFYLAQRAQAISRVEQDFQQLLRSALVEETYLMAHTRELLRVMANAGEMKGGDPRECSQLAGHLLQTQSDYQNFGAVLPNGRLYCSGLPVSRQFDFSDRAWFRDVLAQGEESPGHYIVSQITGRPGILLARPLLNGDGKLRAVVYANTGLGWLERLAFANKLPEGWQAQVILPAGQLVFRQPAAAGGETPPQADAILAAFLATRPGSGVYQLDGPSGQPHLYGVAPLRSAGGEIHVVIGAPKATVLAAVDREFRKHLLLLALVGLLSVVFGQQLIHRSFVRWAERLHANLVRFGAGERGLRRHPGMAIRELREIDEALDHVAGEVDAAERALRGSRQHLDLALAGADLSTWEWHLPSASMTCNAHWAEVPGDQADGGGLEGWAQYVCPDDLPSLRAVLQRHLDGETPACRCEARVRHKDGRWVWLQIHGKVVERDGEGKPLRLAGVALDISDRKATDSALRQRTEELATLLDTIPVPVCIARDPQGREIVCNRAASRLMGMEDDDSRLAANAVGTLPPIRYFRLDGSEFTADDLPMVRAAREARPIENCEVNMLLPDGRSLWVFGNATPLFDELGEVRGVVAAFVETTQFRSVADALRRNEMISSEAGRMLHLGAWSVELFGLDHLGASPVRWSDEMFRLLGYQPGDVEPSIEGFFERVHPDDRQRLRGEAMRALAEARSYSREYRIVWPGGEVRSMLEKVEFRCDAAGRPTHFFGAVRDITEQKQAERALRLHSGQLETLVAERTYELAVAKEAAERASRAKTQFLANISHELRTPLNSLMLLAHVLTDNTWGNLTSQQVEYARMIEMSGNDLMHLIDELLDLAKIETGRFGVEIGSVPFPEIMQSVHRTHRHVAQQKGLEFAMDIGADVPAAIGTDPLRLQQLLRNLMSNAIKFTHAGSVSLRIRRAVSGWRFSNPALSRAECVIAFDVIDTGIGIAPEEQKQIFDAFEQLDAGPARSYGGTGLGLAISAQIAAMLGGELALMSVPRQGSTFTLFLPLDYLGPVAASGPALPSPLPTRLPVEHDPALAGKRVLVVDDDQRNRYAVTAMLERRGIKVLNAAGGSEALAMLEREAVDIVLMDIMMPGMDGYETTRAIRGNAALAPLPVIALTADAMPGTRERCLAAGCSAYLAKPVAIADLLASLREWLDAAATA